MNHVQYIYNGDGQRIYEITDGSLTGFLYDNGILISEYDNGGSVSAQYIHGLGLGHDVGSLICKQTAEDTQYSFYNYRGDVIDTLIGATITSYRYDAFGNLIDSSAPEFGFSSKRYDASTSLSYFGARYYDASLGRFISRDPMGYIDGPNMYIYCSNNPIGHIDPFGTTARQVQEKLSVDVVEIHLPKTESTYSTTANTNIPTQDELQKQADKLWRSMEVNAPTAGMNSGFSSGPMAAMSPEGGGGAVSSLSSLDYVGAINVSAGTTYLASSSQQKQGVVSRAWNWVKSFFGGGNRFNPFYGKTPQQIDQQFKKKGFISKGPDPVKGKGGYVNPVTGRSYHIDDANRYNEPSHVDVNRPKGYKGDLTKRKFHY